MNFRRQLKSIRALVLPACAVLLFACTAYPVNAQRSVEQRLTERASQITGDNFPVSLKTPRGVRVLARTQPNASVLRAIDDGLTELFVVARRHGYRARLEHTAYTVYIARADRDKDSGGNYSPDIAVAAGQYAGSGYDQGGFIYAAGMVLAYNPCAFIIAEHAHDFQRISNVVRYEGEHLVLYYNDRQLYERTADHSRGGGHPILQ
ncbi:MAG: hypothetical protein QOF02_4183 [Blastocatellia bacterium]|jgi:hypothetical protein|nr:hypothetical protein [Blastocatellia bacterium]